MPYLWFNPHLCDDLEQLWKVFWLGLGVAPGCEDVLAKRVDTDVRLDVRLVLENELGDGFALLFGEGVVPMVGLRVHVQEVPVVVVVVPLEVKVSIQVHSVAIRRF